jgi:arylsulfatase A-like enzyme
MHKVAYYRIIKITDINYIKLLPMKSKILAFTLGLLGLTPPLLAQKKEVAKPNIIFIMVDDMGYGDLGVLFQNQRAKANDRNSPWVLTPNLDKMAAQGVQMPQNYCAAPVCAPSRSSILSGKSQGHANVRDNQFDKALEENYTLGSVMKTAGYTTAAIGKWGLQGKDEQAPNWSAHPLNRGFDYYYGYIKHGDGHEHYPKEGKYRGVKEVWENRTLQTPKLDKCYTADLWTAMAKKWIVEQTKTKDKKPFFLYLAYDTPHAVLELPTQPYPSGGGLKGGIQWTGQAGKMINTASGTIDSWIYPDYAKASWDNDKNPATPEVAWPDVYKRYATSNRRIDDAVGDIRQLLKDLNLDQNTMIVFTSDNGPSIESYLDESIVPTFFSSFGPFDGIKRDCWEGGVRMPTLATWPGHIPAGRQINTPSISYDWLPTFTDLAGLPAPAVTDGVSLVPSLMGKGEQPKSLVYVEYFNKEKTPDFADFAPQHQGRKRNQMQLIRMDDLVGVRYDIQSEKDDFEIYNVVKDPGERINLAGNPEMKGLQQQMKDKVLQSRRPNNTAVRPYDKAIVPSIQLKNTTAGVQWKAYDGDFPWVPKVSSLTPVESGFSALPDVNVHKTEKNSAIYIDGYINIPTDGEYTFALTTDNRAVLRIHNAMLIDADYAYFADTEKSESILLKAGFHPFSICYLKGSKAKPRLNLEWSGPGITKQAIPATVLFH